MYVMDTCVNINHPTVLDFSKRLNISPRIVAAKISLWQDKNNTTTEFPKLEDIEVKKEFYELEEKFANTLQTLESFNSDYVKEDGNYKNKKTNLFDTDKTSSRHVASLYKDLEDTKESKERLELGTSIHIAFQEILLDLSKGIVKSYNYPFSEELFQSALVLLSQIKSHQELINNLKGTKGDFKIITEQILIDKNKRIGGSADIVVIFSDNTAGVFDIKTIGQNISEENKTNQVYLEFKKKNAFKLQINEYSNILKYVVGVQDVVMKRVIPIIVNKTDSGYAISTTNYDETVLSNILIDTEKFGLEKTDQFMKSRKELLNRLEKSRKMLYKKQSSGVEIEEINNKIYRLNKSIEEAYINKSFIETIKSAKSLEFEIKKELSKPLEEMDMRKITEQIDELETLLDIQEVAYELSKVTDIEEDTVSEVFTLNTMKDLLSELKSVQRILVVDWFGAQKIVSINRDKRLILNVKPMTSDGFFISNLGNLSDQSNPIFQTSFKKISDLESRKTSEWNKYVFDLRKYSSVQNIKDIVDKKTQMFVKQYDFSSIPRKMTTSSEILKYYEIPKDYSWDQILKDQIEVYDKIYKTEDGGFISKEVKTLYENKLKHFIESNRLFDEKGKLSEKALINLYKKRGLILKNKEKYVSKEYTALTKEQKEALDWFTEWNDKFKSIFGITEDNELPANFIPLIRKDLVDRWKDNNSFIEFSKSQFKDFSDSFTRLASDIEYDSKKIPIPFLNTYENRKEIGEDKSFDLFESFLKFSDYAFHYKYFSDAEPYFHAMKDLLIDKAIINGKKVDESFIKKYEDVVSYYVYRERSKINEELEKFGKESFISKLVGKPVSFNKTVDKLSSYDTATTLGLNFMSSAASQVAGRTAILIEAKKNNLFNLEQHNKAIKERVSNKDNYLAFCGFFDVYPEGGINRLGLKPHEHNWFASNNPDRIKKYINSRNSLLFKNWEWGEEDITNVVTVSMGYNYGIDENNNIKHKRFFKDNFKSLYESTEYNKETGEIKFKNVKGELVEDNEKIYNQFRKAARAGIRNTVGTANTQDMARYKMYLGGRLLMKYKSWLPGVLLERMRNLRVNEYAQVMEIGRYKAVFHGTSDLKGKELVYAIGVKIKDVVANLVGIGGFVGQNFSALDRTKAKIEFEKWKQKMREENPYEIEKLEELTNDEEVQLDMYIQAIQGQLQASMLELRILLGIMLSVFALSHMDLDDDEVPDFKQVMALRRLIRLSEKVRGEIGFLFSVGDWKNQIDRPIPLVSLFTRLGKLLTNTFDTGKDLFSEEDENDYTGAFYYSKMFLPGWKIIDPFLDELNRKEEEAK